MKTKVAVFAYSDVGARCLRALIASDLEIALVVSHADDSNEKRWFASVVEVCHDHGLPVVIDDGNDQALMDRLAELGIDLIFSFYFRRLLPDSLLSLAQMGSFNMHGSLLPDYAGRAPINWAVLAGETRTGVTLHAMTDRADAGAIVAQRSVPILSDDTAWEVQQKAAFAAESCLLESLPNVSQWKMAKQQDLRQRRYFGRRTPQDSRIDWRQSAHTIHNLVRAVSPPFPVAFADTPWGRLELRRSRVVDTSMVCSGELTVVAEGGTRRVIYGSVAQDSLVLLDACLDEQPVSPDTFQSLFHSATVNLTE